MTISKRRLAALSTVSAAAAMFVLPGSAQAQATTCSQAGTLITCVDGPSTVLTGITTANTTTLPGPGLRTVAVIGASTTTYVASGPVTTTAAPAITLSSSGGALSFTPSGTGAPVNIQTIGGIGANGLTLNTAGQSATVAVGNIATSGTNSFGVLSTGGTDLTLQTGNITTTGATSTAIDAVGQTGNISIAAGNVTATGRGLRTAASNSGTNTIVVGDVVTGDRGILANGGTVSVTTGNVTTSTNGGTTPGGFGVAAQAFAGDSTVRTGAVSTVNGPGIVATAFSPTGSVNVSGCPSVATAGNNATAIVAQAAGTGSVTISCGALTTTGNNSNGVFSVSTGGNVLVNITSATTSGLGAYGVTANTSGAGAVTTNAGAITTTGDGSTGLFSRAGTGGIDAGYGNITTSGVGTPGGNASAIDLASSGTINLRAAGTTLRTNGAGVTAAIVNGNGVTGNLGNLVTTGANAQGAIITSTAPVNLTVGTVSTTGNGLTVDAGGNAVTLVVGNVVTGNNGVFANGGAVSVTTGNVTTSTNGGTTPGGAGVTAQASTGNITVRTGVVNTANGGGILATASGATGSVDVGGCPSVTTTGDNAPAVFAQAGGTGSVTINCGAVTTTGNNSYGVVGLSSGGNVLVNITSATTSGSNAVGVGGITNGAATVTTNAGVIATTGDGATGLVIRAGTGAIDAGYGNITTSGVSNGGLFSASAVDLGSSGTINLRGAGATLRTNGAGGTAAIVNGNGVTGNLGSVVTTGANAQGAIITSTAPVNLTVGTVSTTGNGLTVNAGANAVTLTTGTVTASQAGSTGTVINTTGAVNFNGGKQTANGANALLINGGAGAINATVAGAATTGTGTAISIAGTGPLAFTNSGSITTTGANSSGLSISGVTTAAVSCGNVSTTGSNSPAVVVAANGTTNVTCGTVSTTGAGSDAILVNNTADTTTVTGGTTSATGAGSRGIVVSSSAPAATGLVTVNTGDVTANGNAVVATSTGGAAVVVNANGNVTSTTGTGITATTGGTTLVTIGAGTTTSGIQGVNLQGVAGNTLIVNGTLRNAGGTSPYSVLAGGPFTLTLGSTGTIVGPLTFTTGNDTFNNQGTFALPATLDFLAGNDVLNNTGTLTAFTGASLISNLETFNNVGGLIDMRNGAANNVVTLANSNYVASGNARLGIDANGAGGTTLADRLVIGGTTSGTTTVLANIVNPVIDTTGALIVGSTLNNITAGQFVLGGATSFGLINYSAQVRGGNVFLVSTPDARVYETVFAGRQVRDLWYKSADAYNAYATARRMSFGHARSSPLGFWAQLYGENETAGDRSRTATTFGTTLAVFDQIRNRYRGAQAGIDFVTPNFVIGVTGGYERAQGLSNASTTLITEGRNYGAYAQFGMATGFYAGALVKRDDYHVLLTNDAIQGGSAGPQAHSTGAEGELGIRTGGESGVNFDLGAGLAYVRSHMDTFNFGNISFDGNRMTSMRGQLHARASLAGPVGAYIEARGFHEFRGNTSYLLSSGSSSSILDGLGRGTWARLEAGVASGGHGGLISAWADVGDTRGYGVRLGLHF